MTSINSHKCTRTATQVKKKWSNTRSAAKAKVRSNANEKRKTGGGVADVKPLTAVEEVFLQNMPVPPVSINGIPGCRDSNLKIKNPSSAVGTSRDRRELWGAIG